jgi:hypothetical protein
MRTTCVAAFTLLLAIISAQTASAASCLSCRPPWTGSSSTRTVSVTPPVRERSARRGQSTCRRSYPEWTFGQHEARDKPAPLRRQAMVRKRGASADARL